MMPRRLPALAVAISLAAAGCAPAPPDAWAPPPNFVIILADDLGYGDVGPYDGWVATPALDRLAREGLRFLDFHSSGPVCSPTRAGLLTGRYQQRAGIPGVVYADPERNRHHGLHVQETTFAEMLREAGYATGIFGKWHLGYDPRFNPVHHGFDRFRGYVSGNVDYFSHVDGMGFYDWWDGLRQVEEEGYVTHLITRHAVDFIEAHRDRPFCLYIAHEAPHYPFQGPNDEPFRIVGRRVPERVSEDDARRAYREMVTELDRGVSDVLETLDRLGLSEQTLVLFLSDNGAMRFGSNGPWRGFKGSLWEGGHRVPAIARWTGRIPPGATADVLASSIDVMPTVLEAAGVSGSPGPPLDGVSLLPTLLDDRAPEPRLVFWEYRNQASVRDGPWKLLVDADSTRLFHLHDDPTESTDLSSVYPDRTADLRDALETWRGDVAAGATQQPER